MVRRSGLERILIGAGRAIQRSFAKSVFAQPPFAFTALAGKVGCMDIAVLISGVADAKWPLPRELSVASLQTHAAHYAALSPFDEAALELALALRDADPAVRITALVAADEALARRVAGWRPDTIHRLDLDAIPRWDSGATAAALSQAVRELAPAASLVLAGREFGDFDDGSVPAGLARGIDAPYIPLVLSLARGEHGWWALRQAAGGLERVELPTNALLSATNDPGNRLRHPLMKNVMMSKKIALPVWRAQAPVQPAALRLEGVHPATAPARRAACEWLEGSPEQKARALAKTLLEAVH
jgi:electron transfer flavoprotein beta subunit